MDIIKIAITEKELFEKIPTNSKELFVTNCGYSITHHAPSPFFGNPENNYLLLYQHSGNLAIPENESESIISGGNCLLFYPHESRKYRFLDDAYNERYFVYFEGDATKLLTQFGIFGQGRILHTGIMPDIIGHFKNIMADFQINDYECGIYRYTLLLNIFAEIGRNLKQNKLQKATPPPTQIEEIAQYIAESCDHTLNLDDICTKFSISPATLSRHFHKWYNTTPIEYFNKARYDKAAALLIGTALPVSVIAYNLGFNDPLYFSKFFKKRSGLYPSAFREKNRL